MHIMHQQRNVKQAESERACSTKHCTLAESARFAPVSFFVTKLYWAVSLLAHQQYCDKSKTKPINRLPCHR